MKALVIPFEDHAHDPDLQSNIIYKLLTAIEEITASPIATVTPPVPNDQVTKLKQMPITFMASHLTETEYNTLMSRHVWSSKEITFQVVPIDPPCSDFFFTIRGLATFDKKRIHNMVLQVWNNNETLAYIDKEVNKAQEGNRKEIQEIITHLTQSLQVTLLKIKDKNRALKPHFNILKPRQDPQHCGNRQADILVYT
jgi:hypothetical protein